MLENQAKGWHGSYSLAGRNSAEKYHIIIHKDDVLGNEHKTIKIKDIFTPDDDVQEVTKEDNLDVFKAYTNKNREKNISSPTHEHNKIYLKNDPERFKYHRKHMKEVEKEKEKKRKNKELSLEGNEIIYQPKHEFVWSRTIIGPKWDIPRKGFRKVPKAPGHELIFYTKKVPNISQSFIIMNKQTKRGSFAGNVDIRIRNDKAYNEEEEREKVRKAMSHPLKTFNCESKTGIKIETLTNLSPKTMSSLISAENINFNKTSPASKKSIKFRRHKEVKKGKIKAPDFGKIISREQVEKVKGIKPTNVAYIIPNYSYVRERPLTMAVYDRPQKSKKLYERMPGIDPSLLYDPDKIINKVNNHVYSSPPNFEIMTSRPNEDKILPTYMQKMFNRQSIYDITDKTLKLNNFRNGAFKTASSSFCKKKSFNNYVNLNLLNSDAFQVEKRRKIDKHAELDSDMVIEKERLQRSVKFLNQDIDQLLKEGSYNKFDNITYQTIKHEHKIDPNDIDKFLLNFDYANS